jgi:signal transduction histidine kinase
MSRPTRSGTGIRRIAYVGYALDVTPRQASSPNVVAMNELLRRWWLVPVLFVVGAGSIAVNVHGSQPDRWFPVALAALAAVVLFAIDRFPWAVVANGALVGGYFLADGDNGPIFLTIVVATFLVALRRPPRQWVPLVVVAAVLVWAGLTVRGYRSDAVDLRVWQSLGVGALSAAAAAIATSVRVRTEARADRARRAASEEKLRMAQDLHDGVGHGLAVIAMQAGVALHVLDRDLAGARRSLEAIRETSTEALEALRAELSQLTGDAAQRAPRRTLADLDALVARVAAAGLRVTRSGDSADTPVHPTALSTDLEATAYAVVQEALTNVLRHADATAVDLRIERQREALVVTVTDDGRGGPVQDEGMGLSGMRSRIESRGGTLTVGPRAQGGFEVRAVLPA